MRKAIAWTLSGLAVSTAGLVFLAYATPAAASPSVVWSPASVAAPLKPNESTTTQVVLTVSEAIEKGTVRVVPALAPYVTVSPATIAKLEKGKQFTLSIKLSLPVDASPESIEGAIQLRADGSFGKPGPTLSKPLPVKIAVVCPCLPPDPGEAGKVTIEGIDSDNDGVRDDVQRLIARMYPGSARLRAAATQLAAAYQDSLRPDLTYESAELILKRIFQATDCAKQTDPTEERRLSVFIEAGVLNTMDRVHASDAFDQRFNGSVLPSPDEAGRVSPCVMNPSALPN